MPPYSSSRRTQLQLRHPAVLRWVAGRWIKAARTALAAALDSGMGARKRPSARFSRYASGADPTTIRSAEHSSPSGGCCAVLWEKKTLRMYSSR